MTTGGLHAWTDETAGLFATTLVSMSDWVNRRVESVSFFDDETVARRISIDFTVPEWAPLIGSRALIPLAFLDKRPITSLDVRDSSDRALTVLTTKQNGSLAVAALHSVAVAAVDAAQPEKPLPDLAAVDNCLNRIVFGEPNAARRAYAELRAQLTSKDSAADLAALADNTFFMDIVETFISNFILATQVRLSPGERDVVKFRYVEDARGSADERGRFERLTDRLGWTPHTLAFAVPGAGIAASFHFEIEVPTGTAVTTTYLTRESTGTSEIRRFGARGRQLVHLMTPADGPQSDYSITTDLRISRTGWLRSSLGAATAIAVMMTASSARVETLLHPRRSGRPTVDVAAILLTLVAVLAAIVVRSGEHALTSRLLVGPRTLVLTSVAVPFIGAWFLAFGPTGAALRYCWWLLAGISWCPVLALATTYLGPRSEPGDA